MPIPDAGLVEAAILLLIRPPAAPAARGPRTFPNPQTSVGGDPGDVAAVPEDALLPSDIRRLPLLSLGAQGPSSPFPPYQIPPQGAYLQDLPLDTTGVVVLGGAQATIAVWPVVPLGMLGVVRKIGWTTTNFLTTRFTTLVNGAPVQPYPGRIGPVGTLEVPQDTQIILQPWDIFSVVALNTGAPAVTVQVRTWGWFWLSGA
jgi:hypothetical protein